MADQRDGLHLRRQRLLQAAQSLSFDLVEPALHARRFLGVLEPFLAVHVDEVHEHRNAGKARNVQVLNHARTKDHDGVETGRLGPAGQQTPEPVALEQTFGGGPARRQGAGGVDPAPIASQPQAGHVRCTGVRGPVAFPARAVLPQERPERRPPVAPGTATCGTSGCGRPGSADRARGGPGRGFLGGDGVTDESCVVCTMDVPLQRQRSGWRSCMAGESQRRPKRKVFKRTSNFFSVVVKLT